MGGITVMRSGCSQDCYTCMCTGGDMDQASKTLIGMSLEQNHPTQLLLAVSLDMVSHTKYTKSSEVN